MAKRNDKYRQWGPLGFFSTDNPHSDRVAAEAESKDLSRLQEEWDEDVPFFEEEEESEDARHHRLKREYYCGGGFEAEQKFLRKKFFETAKTFLNLVGDPVRATDKLLDLIRQEEEGDQPPKEGGLRDLVLEKMKEEQAKEDGLGEKVRRALREPD